MRIQFLKTLSNGNVTTKKGTIVEMDNWKAGELIGLGYAVRIPDVEDSIAAPLVAAPLSPANDNAGERADPFPAPLIGSRDGSEKPASLLPAAPAPRKRNSRKRKGVAG